MGAILSLAASERLKDNFPCKPLGILKACQQFAATAFSYEASRATPMKVVFSRKGWDSGFGGRANPVFVDSTIQSIPIECKDGSPSLDCVTPRALKKQGFASLSTFLAEYYPRLDRPEWAHLDPDLDAVAFRRAPGWLPCFGQDSAAASHLDNRGILEGDLFLFYGWFDDMVVKDGRWIAKGNHRFLIWGWLQIGEIFRAPARSTAPAWLHDHPHIVQTYPLKNRIYVANESLKISDQVVTGWPGGGIFGRELPARNLTKNPGRRGLYPDKLPAWLKMTKYRQEHVWDTSQSLEADSYLRSLFV